MAEEDRMLRTPDEKVRRQIEAVKSQLRHHFRDVEDAPAIQSAVFDGLHTISMVTGEHRPVLQLEYAWLEEHQRSEVLKALPPTPSVVEYPNGRHELRGDGVTMPYTWVWIPKPPPPPAPPETAPTVPPAAPGDAPADPPSTERRPSGPRAEIYRWTDEQGVTTWMDRLEKIPERYRAQAQRPARTNEASVSMV